MKRWLFAAALTVALICSCTGHAQACDQAKGDLLTGVLLPAALELGGQYLANGEIDFQHYWELNKGETLAEITGALLPKARGILAELQVKAEAGDQTLEEYIRDNYTAELWALIEARGGAVWVLKELAEISPRLAAFLAEWGPDALSYAANEKLIAAPTLQALIDGWPPKPTDDQLETIALLAVQAWIRTRNASRAEGLEVE